LVSAMATTFCVRFCTEVYDDVYVGGVVFAGAKRTYCDMMSVAKCIDHSSLQMRVVR
jgi:hypothetical protein